MTTSQLARTPARSPREVCRDLVITLMSQDERVVCLDSDTGLFTGADFGAAAARYVNLGIAEQNLIGMAAGLAAAGWLPFVHTMAAFASTRALEAVKIDVALNALPVRIVATHAGVSAGHLGPTHHCLEDLACLRVLPNMTVVVPADAAAARDLLRQGSELPGPLYLRLGKNATQDLPPAAGPASLGRARLLRAGPDATIAACGPLPVLAALAAAEQLANEGAAVTVLDVHTVKPLDVTTLAECVPANRCVVTVEEHWRAGGFGSAVAEALCEQLPVRVLRMGIPDVFADVAGSQPYLMEHFGVTAQSVADRVRRVLDAGAAAGSPWC